MARVSVDRSEKSEFSQLGSQRSIRGVQLSSHSSPVSVAQLDVERDSTRSERPVNVFRRVVSHMRGSTGTGADDPLSPRRSDVSGIETAERMLSPVLSRAREWQSELAEQAEQAEQAGEVPAGSPHAHESLATTTPSVASPRRSEKSDQPSAFRGAAQALNALSHPVHMPRYRGGEGIRRLVETREKNKHFLGLSVEYWDISLFSFRGRAWPMLPQLMYSVYNTVIVIIVCQLVRGYRDIQELQGLQYLISTMGLALFLLLSFRTNSSYERWWEGRKLWDGISTKCEDLTRLALGWMALKDRHNASSVIRWALAFAFVAKKTLRVEQEFPELAGILSQKEIDELEGDIDPVALVSDKLTALVNQACIGPSETHPVIISTMDNNVKGLNADLTACMRILGTPMPFAYIIHLRSFIVLWLLGLPFAFLPTLGYYTIIVCTVVGYELLGFETISVEVENPFGTDFNDLPLDTITTELFVKCASALARLGHMVDVEPMVKADPLYDQVRRHPPTNLQSRNNSAEAEEVLTLNGMRDSKPRKPSHITIDVGE